MRRHERFRDVGASGDAQPLATAGVPRGEGVQVVEPVAHPPQRPVAVVQAAPAQPAGGRLRQRRVAQWRVAQETGPELGSLHLAPPSGRSGNYVYDTAT